MPQTTATPIAAHDIHLSGGVGALMGFAQLRQQDAHGDGHGRPEQDDCDQNGAPGRGGRATLCLTRLALAFVRVLGPAPARALAGRRESEQIRRLRVTPQHLHRQNGCQLEQSPPAAEPYPAVDSMRSQRQPRRTHQINHIAVLKQDRSTERVAMAPSADPNGLVPHDRKSKSIVANAIAVCITM